MTELGFDVLRQGEAIFDELRDQWAERIGAAELERIEDHLAGLRALRWWAFALTAAYATALILWAVLPDRAPSLSKDLHPVVAGIIIVAAIGAAITYHVLRRRSEDA